MEEIVINVDEYVVHLVFHPGTNKMLDDAKHKGIPLGGQYSAKVHQAHSSGGDKHIHVYTRNNQIFALNKSSTAHDQSHGVTIPNKVAKAIRKQFPNFVIPPGNFIESAPLAVQVLFSLKDYNG